MLINLINEKDIDKSINSYELRSDILIGCADRVH